MTTAKRATATVKMTYHEDGDLIAWWNSLPRGSRNAVMKDMMREYIEQQRGSFRPVFPRNLPQPFDPNRFSQMCEDAAWIRSALMDLPGYVERVIQYVSSVAPTARSPAESVSPASVSTESAHRREQRIRKAQW